MKANSLKRCLVIIDDDKVFCDSIKVAFRKECIDVIVAHTGADGVAICNNRNVDVVLLDQKLPDGEGRSFCPAILKHNDQAKVIFITAYPSFANAVKGIKVGAHDYLSKPFELEELRLAVNQAMRTVDLEKVAQLQNYKRDKDDSETVLISGGGLAEIEEIVGLTETSDAPLIITGETGTGKNVVAKYIHYHGSRKSAPFININCAAIPENLIESELFGSEKGAFTGATSTHRGVFEMAEGGTLLLDEIGDMPLSLQTKLLSVLEEGQIRRLGSESMRPVNVRIIAATNSNLENAVQEKLFREDLYFRLNVIRVHLPPLRERPQDIHNLCEYFLQKRPNAQQYLLPRSELRHLLAYDWPGNVRELKNIIERAVIFQENGTIYPSKLLKNNMKELSVPPDARVSQSYPPFSTLEELAKSHTLHVLEQLSGNVTKTAKVLGLSLSTLKRRLKEYAVKPT